ncbi:MAG: hypothetical protein JSV77_03850, partial [Dehalococcoidales bacterium]
EILFGYLLEIFFVPFDDIFFARILHQDLFYLNHRDLAFLSKPCYWLGSGVFYIDLPGFVEGPCPRTTAVSVIGRQLFFDYQDTVWRIKVLSDAGNADQAKLDYEHILGTLRILD